MRFEKVLVTGGSGFLGRFVVDELESRCEVSVLDLEAPHQPVSFHRADILDLHAVHSALRGQQAVIHLAGIDDGRDFPDRDFFQTNVQGAWNVLFAAEAAGARHVVIASSTATLGIGRARMPDYIPIDEHHPLRPKATYSLTKQVIEVVARSFVARGRLTAVCLRPTLIVRPEREAAYLAQLALEDPDADPPEGYVDAHGVKPYGALSATRTYVRSRDAARCFRLGLDYDRERFDVFNVSASDSIGRVRALERLQQVCGKLPEVRDPERFRKDPHASVLDASRAREHLGWEPSGDWNTLAREHRR